MLLTVYTNKTYVPSSFIAFGENAIEGSLFHFFSLSYTYMMMHQHLNGAVTLPVCTSLYADTRDAHTYASMTLYAFAIGAYYYTDDYALCIDRRVHRLIMHDDDDSEIDAVKTYCSICTSSATSLLDWMHTWLKLGLLTPCP